MPWQSRAADVALELDPATGLPWYGLVIVTVQRQAGKTKLISDAADHRCLLTEQARVWYTAQTGKDASAWMRDEHFANLDRAAGIFGRPGSAACRYVRSKRAGAEGIDWRHGSTFRVFPPLRDALHGRQSDLAFVDEAWSISPQQGHDLRQAIRPTMNTRPGAQLWILSTMGDDSSVWWDAYVERARASLGDPNARVCIIDYGLCDGEDPEDLDLIAARHPAYGHTLTMSALLAAREDFRDDPSGWARAYGNMPTRTRVAAIPPAVWAAASIPRPTTVPDRAGLGLDVTPDGRRAAIAAAWPEDDDTTIVELLHTGPPNRDTARYVAGLIRARRVPITVDRGSVAAVELLDLVAQELDNPADQINYLTTADYGSSCVAFDRGLADGTIRVVPDPDLDNAAALVTRRPIGDGAIGWGRAASSGSIAEIVAATVAVRAYTRLPLPSAKPRILT